MGVGFGMSETLTWHFGLVTAVARSKVEERTQWVLDIGHVAIFWRGRLLGSSKMSRNMYRQ